MTFEVRLLPDADAELKALPKLERAAMVNALTKLAEIGDQLGAPHTSAVRGIDFPLREPRPRQGDSPWRAFFCRVDTDFVVGAIRPEARQNRRGFDRSVRNAVTRIQKLAEVSEEHE